MKKNLFALSFILVIWIIIAGVLIFGNKQPNFGEYKELLEENQVLKDNIQAYKNNYKIVINDYLELTSNLCSMGVDDIFCNGFTMLRIYNCDEDGEIESYNWKGVVISKNNTCNVDRMTTLTVKNLVVYVND